VSDPRPADRPAASFADPVLLPGRGLAELVPWALQALALLGDLAAFYTVLALLFRTSPVTLLAIAAGFAAIAVSVAHAAGVLWARWRCRDPRASRVLLGLALAGWLLLGLVAFVARAEAPRASASSGFGSSTGHVTTDLITAAVFIGLYLASGLGAVVAAYLQHNPLHTGLRRAATVLRAAVRREAAARARLARAVAVLEQHDRERERELARRDSARSIVLARMAELQNHARLLIAIGKQDPGHTDGVTGSGPVPELPLPARALPEGPRREISLTKSTRRENS